MATPFVGEIKLVPYNFAPRGWAMCDGSILPISQYDALYSLIGTMYGGDGQDTFGLPDLRGRVMVSGSVSNLGEMAGVEEVTLTTPQMPAHKHTLAVSGQPGTSANPVGQHLAESTLSNFKSYGPGSGAVMPSSTISLSGGSTPHNNLQPYLSLNYVIALEGIYPSRN